MSRERDDCAKCRGEKSALYKEIKTAEKRREKRLPIATNLDVIAELKDRIKGCYCKTGDKET